MPDGGDRSGHRMGGVARPGASPCRVGPGRPWRYLAVREQCAGCGFLREKTHRSDTTRDVFRVHTSHLSHKPYTYPVRRPFRHFTSRVPASCDCRAIIGHRMPHAHAPCPWHGRLVRCRCAIAGHCCSHTARKWPGGRARFAAPVAAPAHVAGYQSLHSPCSPTLSVTPCSLSHCH